MEKMRLVEMGDFSRPWLIGICKDGTCSFWQRGQKKPVKRALRFFSVDTADEARSTIEGIDDARNLAPPSLGNSAT